MSWYRQTSVSLLLHLIQLIKCANVYTLHFTNISRAELYYTEETIIRVSYEDN
jgi:hypothetical protein